MKVTIYKKDKNHTNLGEFNISHVSIFGDKMRLTLNFTIDEELLNFVKVCIKEYVLINIHGCHVTLLLEADINQRVDLRFDDGR